MTVTVAKFNSRVVEIVRVAREVKFSEKKNWVMVCFDFEKSESKKQQFKWVPAETRFDWVRTFSF
jgi:hypothetical protein